MKSRVTGKFCINFKLCEVRYMDRYGIILITLGCRIPLARLVKTEKTIYDKKVGSLILKLGIGTNLTISVILNAAYSNAI